MDIMEKIIKTPKKKGSSDKSIWLNKEEIPEPFKLEGSKLTELT